MNDAENFAAKLKMQGICEDVVDPSSIQGKDHPTNATSRKTYFRSVSFPAWGVLLARADAMRDLNATMSKLENEFGNFATLERYGFDVPKTPIKPFRITHHCFGCEVAALIVEHIDGTGPYKTKTNYLTIWKFCSGLDEPDRQNARNSWDCLRKLCAEHMPRDHQVMITETGRLVTIDPEQIGQSFELKEWPTK